MRLLRLDTLGMIRVALGALQKCEFFLGPRANHWFSPLPDGIFSPIIPAAGTSKRSTRAAEARNLGNFSGFAPAPTANALSFGKLRLLEKIF
jgi:hypothetical protein